jgi:hypothetical protein
MADTKAEFEYVIGMCREVFMKKMRDYGASWRLMRPESLTDQIFIKARRIRTLELKQESKVGEGIYPEFMGMANYGIMALIQLELGFADKVDLDANKALELYDHYMKITTELMYNKNSDYDEAWRYMRVNSYTDIILTKLERIKQIEDNDGKTIVSEGVDANYMDIVNYSLLGVIKLGDDKK